MATIAFQSNTPNLRIEKSCSFEQEYGVDVRRAWPNRPRAKEGASCKSIIPKMGLIEPNRTVSRQGSGEMSIQVTYLLRNKLYK